MAHGAPGGRDGVGSPGADAAGGESECGARCPGSLLREARLHFTVKPPAQAPLRQKPAQRPAWRRAAPAATRAPHIPALSQPRAPLLARLSKQVARSPHSVNSACSPWWIL
ncbi:hypothetical protein NDU88_007690 [Pleurodeles waltl]|uniref:Uncharacterized protein n=1 Tax=Pleurodeles waltl TaxID=8319 RepID=A0AAV7VT52_PLEWA|nr:hypothetical protein NDU88_007690 [Pleurodeles waltl]